jgi:hypothetical protein
MSSAARRVQECMTRSRWLSLLLLEEIAAPLGVGDEIYFGMPPAEQHRLAVLEDAAPAGGPMPEMPPDLPMFRAAPMSLMPTAAFGNREDVLAADIPAGGKTSARAIARMYASMLGPIDGVRLLREATSVSTSGTDEVFGMPTRWGWGTRSECPACPTRSHRPLSGSAAWAAASRGPIEQPGSPSP